MEIHSYIAAISCVIMVSTVISSDRPVLLFSCSPVVLLSCCLLVLCGAAAIHVAWLLNVALIFGADDLGNTFKWLMFVRHKSVERTGCVGLRWFFLKRGLRRFLG